MNAFFEAALRDAFATRYWTAAGVIILMYDHLLTFVDEVKYIWPAPSSYAKFTFLFNRYLVLAVLLTTAYETSGLLPSAFSDAFLFACAMLSVISIGIANLLILQRVVILWEHRPIILKIMTAGFLMSLVAQVVLMALTLISSLPHIIWSNTVHMCVATQMSKLYIAVWAGPLVFEVFVLAATGLNALDRPRTAEAPLARALVSDGVGFFLAITCCRIINVVIVSVARPSLSFVAVFLIWGMITTILNRLLLHLRTTELGHASSLSARALVRHASNDPARAISPFGLPAGPRASFASSLDEDEDKYDEEAAHGHGGVWELELGERAPDGHVYHYRKRAQDLDARPWDY